MSYITILTIPAGYSDLEIDHNTSDNTLDVDVTVESGSYSFTLQIPDVIKLRDYLNTLDLREQNHE